MKFYQHLNPEYVSTLKNKTIRNRMNEIAGRFAYDKLPLKLGLYDSEDLASINTDEMNMSIYQVELCQREHKRLKENLAYAKVLLRKEKAM